MRLVTGLNPMQRLALNWRRQGVRTALVPTMGCLHEGHLSLVRQARRLVRRDGKVVVSIYVNPSQFGAREDFVQYPRDLERDKRSCRKAGVDVLFVPASEEVYPGVAGNPYSTWVVEDSLASVLEGRARPSHFRGVTTIVAKLFNLIAPEVAVFGGKDYQQALIVEKMVKDLNFPVQVVVAPTIREADGLAMSSRNTYLSPAQRRQAGVLWRCLQEADAAVKRRPSGIAAGKLRARVERLIEAEPDVRVDYIEFFEHRTLRPVRLVRRGSHLALAVYVGTTRLIDNARLAG